MCSGLKAPSEEGEVKHLDVQWLCLKYYRTSWQISTQIWEKCRKIWFFESDHVFQELPFRVELTVQFDITLDLNAHGRVVAVQV